ncbi:unnamed protein product [Meloidogyne enterolobii]|uniref:Uncharacterized protein n=1 Tax=Meloidogyne enterolobii TaxID=390850 RepID=A0ACB0Z4D9_MELEN
MTVPIFTSPRNRIECLLFYLGEDPVAIQRLREAVEKAKCELSASTLTEIILPNIILDTNGLKHFRIKLTRSKFEKLTENLIQKIVQLVQKTLNNAEMENQAYDKDAQLDNVEKDLQQSTSDISVLVVGGMSKIPKIKNGFEEIFKKKKIYNDSQLEDGAISTGAIYLGVLFGDINYLDDRRASNNRIFAAASQKMFIEERIIDRMFDRRLAKRVFYIFLYNFFKLFWILLHYRLILLFLSIGVSQKNPKKKLPKIFRGQKFSS